MLWRGAAGWIPCFIFPTAKITFESFLFLRQLGAPVRRTFSLREMNPYPSTCSKGALVRSTHLVPRAFHPGILKALRCRATCEPALRLAASLRLVLRGLGEVGCRFGESVLISRSFGSPASHGCNLQRKLVAPPEKRWGVAGKREKTV